MPAPKLTKASVSNAIDAAASSGLAVSAVLLQPDGSMRIEFFRPDFADTANANPEPNMPKKWGQKR